MYIYKPRRNDKEYRPREPRRQGLGKSRKNVHCPVTYFTHSVYDAHTHTHTYIQIFCAYTYLARTRVISRTNDDEGRVYIIIFIRRVEFVVFFFFVFRNRVVGLERADRRDRVHARLECARSPHERPERE